MSATQEDYAYVYDTTILAPTTLTARKFIAAINKMLSSPLPNIHHWEVVQYNTAPPAARASILIRNKNDNNRCIRIQESGDFDLRAKFSDVGQPVGDYLNNANWPLGSSPDIADAFGGARIFRTPSFSPDLSYITGKVYIAEYVDAFCFIVEGKGAGAPGWRFASMIGKVINTLNKSDEQSWNGNSEAITPINYRGGFNGEGMITGFSNHMGDVLGWLRNSDAPGALDVTTRSLIRTDVDYWSYVNTDYNYFIGATDFNNNGSFITAAPLHLRVNDAERLIPYPVINGDSLLGFTRYHRSFGFEISHGTLIKSSETLSKQAWFAYKGNMTASSTFPKKTNTCILWNKDGSVTIP